MTSINTKISPRYVVQRMSASSIYALLYDDCFNYERDQTRRHLFFSGLQLIFGDDGDLLALRSHVCGHSSVLCLFLLKMVGSRRRRHRLKG